MDPDAVGHDSHLLPKRLINASGREILRLETLQGRKAPVCHVYSENKSWSTVGK